MPDLTQSGSRHTAPFDFDTPVDRRGTGSLKWDRYKGRDVIPLWLADMDFRSPPAVLEALRQRVDHGVFGYTLPPEDLVEALIASMRTDYAWEIRREWIVWLPGLVTGLNLACRATGEDGDDVMTAIPVYPPFLTAPGQSRRNLVTVPLELADGRWGFNFDLLEEAITPRTRLFLLCSPHNPVGRAFSREELSRLHAICEKHDIVICSDEIHCGLILDKGMRHIPTATLSPEASERTITLMAPSKTYNLPGLGCSFAVIPNSRLRRRFQDAMLGIVPHVNILGFTAATAAYRDSGDWLAGLVTYLRANHDVLMEAIRNIPGLSMTRVEATYLAWIDTRRLTGYEPVKFFEDAGVGLYDGREFGGPGYVRLNFGCPRSTLEQALRRMAHAMERLV